MPGDDGEDDDARNYLQSFLLPTALQDDVWFLLHFFFSSFGTSSCPHSGVVVEVVDVVGRGFCAVVSPHSKIERQMKRFEHELMRWKSVAECLNCSDVWAFCF